MSRALTLLLLVSLVLTACSKNETLNVSGIWVGEATSEVTLPLRLDLEQTGQTLTGTVTLAEVVELDLTGKVDAQQVSFSFSYNLGSISGGNEIVAYYAFTGTVTGNTLAGDVSVSADSAGPPLPPVAGTFKVQKQP